MGVLKNGNVRFLNDQRTPMRDGVELSADVYLPEGGEGPWPVILARTPYDNTGLVDAAIWFNHHGYAFVAQDVRGRFDSDGHFVPWDAETDDGYDTLDWITQQPWCDGNIGMSGGSYLGQVQWQAAFTQHPALKAIAPRVMGNNLWDSPHWQGGAFGLGVNAIWGWRTMARGTQRIDIFDWPKLLRSVPLRLMDKLSGKKHPAFSTWLDHPDYDDYWRATAVDEHFDRFTIPVLQVCGWYDLYAGGMMENFVGLRKHAGNALSRENQQIIMGPWSHPQAGLLFSPGTTNVGDRDFGPGSLLNTAAIELAWWDHWLKGIDNGAEKAAPVKIFIMGADVWRDEQEWPLARTEWTPYYLHSGGNANSVHGDGVLSTAHPDGEAFDTFRYDPAFPVQTLGGCNCCNPEHIPWGIFDQSEVEARHDVLVYSTPVLEADIEVTGPVKMHLFAATDGLDTDFTAKLVDVHPDGRPFNVCDGILRGRYRKGRQPAELLTPGEVYEFVIDLWVTAQVFKVGHRIRVEISSSNFPRFDRNLNTGGPIGEEADGRIATQQVFHDANHRSHILLPVIPAEA